MNVTKQQIINGIVRYTKDEVIPKIPDKPFKMAIAVAILMLESNSEISNKFFENNIVSMILDKNDDGTYDIEKISAALEKTLTEYGDFPVTIPAIKFISPTEKALNFSCQDIKTLKNYIAGGIT